MALGITFIGKPKNVGKYVYLRGTLAFDNSYATNGLDYSTLLKNEIQINVLPKNGLEFDVDYTNKKIKAFWYNYPGAAAAQGVEVTAATDLSTAGTGAAVPFEAQLLKI